MKTEIALSNAVTVEADDPATYLRLLLAKYCDVRAYRVAERLGISRPLLSLCLSGRARLTPERAEAIGRAILEERAARSEANALSAREASERARSVVGVASPSEETRSR